VLRDALERQGDFFFRWRGFLPLLGLPILAWELYRFSAEPADPRVAAACLAVAGLGVAVRAAVQGYTMPGSSGRNTRWQKANALHTTGLYSLCRHPLYLGNFLICFGVLLLFRSFELLAVFGLLCALYYERIVLCEEAYLEREYGESFRAWAARTPAFLPRPSAWQRPERPFRVRTLVRREYGTWFSVVLVATLFEALLGWRVHGRLSLGPAWLSLLALASLQFAVFRFLKKRTRLLRL
jgi:protein-S-isoprenylcysteine O-methyltransferase Ste14